MLVTLRTLTQQTFKIEIDPEEKVVDLKKKIEEEKGPSFAVANQKLIYAGKILSDDSKISGCEIDEAKYVVIMVIPPKAAPTESTPSATASATNKPTSTPVTGASGSGAASTTTTSAAGAPTDTNKPLAKKEPTGKEGSASTPSAESNLVLGDQFEDMVKQIMEMGYNRPEVELALKASFNNPERAVEYLINGLPLDASAAVGNESNTPASGVESGGLTSLAENVAVTPSDPSNPLAFLRTQPMFLQMRQIIQQDPLSLYNLMQQIRETNPNLYELINRNQETFVRMLNDESSGQGGGGTVTGTGAVPPSLNNPLSVTGGGVGAPPASGFPSGIENLVAHVTQADKEAIERLKALGFPEYLVIQAYFACDKNENSAANFLLSQAFDD